MSSALYQSSDSNRSNYTREPETTAKPKSTVSFLASKGGAASSSLSAVGGLSGSATGDSMANALLQAYQTDRSAPARGGDANVNQPLQPDTAPNTATEIAAELAAEMEHQADYQPTPNPLATPKTAIKRVSKTVRVADQINQKFARRAKDFGLTHQAIMMGLICDWLSRDDEAAKAVSSACDTLSNV